MWQKSGYGLDTPEMLYTSLEMQSILDPSWLSDTFVLSEWIKLGGS